MSRGVFRTCLLSLLALFWLNVVALPAFAANEVYAIQVGTVYYEATADGVKASNTVVAKETITHLFADANVVQVGREDERFIGCAQLQVIDFSKASSLQIIYSETFRNCTSLHTVVLPATVNDVQSGAFRGCTALKTIDLSKTAITKISNHLFNGCTALETVAFPAALTEIDYYAFHGCTSLVLGSSVQNTRLQAIRNHAFYACSSIATVALPSTVKTLESNTFAQCVNLTTLALGATPPSAQKDTFTNCAQTGVLQIEETAVDAYQAVNDGDATDLYWYGWLTEQINVSEQLRLSVASWVYQADGAPVTLLSNGEKTIASNTTYFYATEENGAYQSLDTLPHSTAGEIEVGTYWCLAIYDAPCEYGSASSTFTVTPKEITATIWVLGIEKVYDGTTDVLGMQPTVVMSGGLDNDDVTAKGKFAYASADVGENKKIAASDFVLTGVDAGNYLLASTVASENGAVITQASATIPYPTASDIEKGDALSESTLTQGDVSHLDVTGEWQWVDDATIPAETGKFPAVFVPDSANYQTYGPVDVQVVVHERVAGTDGTANEKDASDTTGENGDGSQTDGAGNEEATGVFGGLFGGLFGGDRTEIQDDEVPLVSAVKSSAGWALLNLVLCIAVVAAGMVCLLDYFFARKVAMEDDERECKAQGAFYGCVRLLTLLPAVVSVLLFLLTEDMSTTMHFVDKWTLVMLFLCLLQGCLLFYAWKTDQEIEEGAAEGTNVPAPTTATRGHAFTSLFYRGKH